MYKNIKSLMLEGKKDEALVTRGGARHTYYVFYFVKVAKNKINVYRGSSWQQGEYKTIPVAKLTDKYIMLTPHDEDRKTSKKGWNIWDIASFLSLNLLYNTYTKWSRGQDIIHNNGLEFVPFSGKIKFDWNGKLLTKIPKWAQKQYDKYKELDRTTRNRNSRARYHDNKAEERFVAAGNNLDLVPIEDAFKHRNSVRRRRIVNHYGLEKVLAPYNEKLLDKDTINGNKYELIEVTIPLASTQWINHRQIESNERVCVYLKMINPSTGDYHLEGVPRETDSQADHIAGDTVKSALAWRDGEIPRKSWQDNSSSEEWKKKLSNYSYIEPTTLT